MLRVSIFQKNLQRGLDLDSLKQLSFLKSDFLLLPEYFYADGKIKNYSDALRGSKEAQAWLRRLSKAYKGAIIGGTMMYEDGGSSRVGTPIVKQGEIIDWYNHKILNRREARLCSPGEREEAFILSGVRFLVISYEDLQDKEHIEAVAKGNVRLLFAIINIFPERGNANTKQELIALAQKYGLYIVLCCAVSRSFQGELSGCSLVASPQGLSWHSSEQERSKELLRTVLLSP